MKVNFTIHSEPVAKARLEAKGKLSKRKAKKLKNRFDEENEVIEYNFKSKIKG